MKAAEMVMRFDFHDSNVIKISHSDNRVEMIIDLCAWRQKWMQDSSAEIEQIKLVFDLIDRFCWASDKDISAIDYDTILDVDYNDGELKMVLFDEDVSIISFKCDDVTIEFAAADSDENRLSKEAGD